MTVHSRLHRHPREVLEFVAALECAGRALRMARRGVSASAGLTIGEWRMLRTVQAAGGKPSVFPVDIGSARAAPSISSLAQRLGTTRQTAHRTVATLCAAKLVQIEIRGGDRRRRAVCLTPLGERSLATLESTMRELLLEVSNDLTAFSLAVMSEAMTRLSRRLRSCPTIVRAARRGRRRGPPSGKIRQQG